jgi:uncharacterized membrane protein YfcA
MDILAFIANGLGGINITDILLLALIISVSGFISGLTGFGFSLFGIFSLWILPPREAIPLLMALSLTNQALSLSKLRNEMLPIQQWWPLGPAPFILGGFIGIPIGIHLLLSTNPFALDEIIGSALVVYAIWMGFKGNAPVLSSNPQPLRIAVGTIAGIVGGIIAAPGPIVVIWATMAGLSKEGQRAIVQPFILSLQIVAITDYAINGPGFHTQFAILYGLLVPFVIASTHFGVWTFKHIQNHQFQKAVMLLLALSGISLIFKGKMFWGDFLMTHHLHQMM